MGKDSYVDETALLVGDVSLGEGVTVWPGAIVRGDDDSIEIGPGTAIMDMAFIEAPEGMPVTIGSECIISHGAKLHGCRIEEGTLVGIGAIVLDGAVIEKGAILAAGSVLPPGGRVPPMTLALGSPARAAREVTDADRESVTKGLEAIRVKAAQYDLEK